MSALSAVRGVSALSGVAEVAAADPAAGDVEFRSLVGALFAVHRRVLVRLPDGSAGPAFCTCGDVWPCGNESRAATVLDFPPLDS